MDSLRIYFILPNECENELEVSDKMLQAYETCRQHVDDVTWLKEDDVKTDDFNKTDILIFDNFTGSTFERVKDSKCVVLGPTCVYECFLQNKKVPNYPWPILNIGMYDCIVTCSHLPKSRKNEIKAKIEMMGGCTTDKLLSTNTHLITDSVNTEKYFQAVEAGVKIMVQEWVEAVWADNQNMNTHCDSEKYQKYRCPPFHKLTISSTGITISTKRQELCQLVVANGGIFTGNLSVSTTDVLVCDGPAGTTSAKYKAARSSANIRCVTYDWITASIEKGYAQPYDLYQVKKSTSTPTKGDTNINPNFSTLSVIAPIHNQTTLEETLNFSTRSSVQSNTPSKRSTDYQSIINNLDFKKLKKAGSYLDGCGVYIAGFNPEHREKLCKVLNLSGATRYDDLNSRITHVIVGDVNAQEIKDMRSLNYSCSFVSIHWLLESMNQKQAVDEEKYLINFSEVNEAEPNSPLSQKGISLLRSTVSVVKDNEEPQIQSDRPSNDTESYMVQQYLQQDTDTLARLLENDDNFTTNISATKDTTLQTQTQEAVDFGNFKFQIINFENDIYEDLKKDIENFGGTVLSKSFKGIPDILVVPIFNSTPIQQTATAIVNNLWIRECVQDGKPCEILYYHKPLILQNAKPLKDCVITVSNYSNYERNFLKYLIIELGGTYQEQLVRLASDVRKVEPSTHLICMTAEGRKYEAAIKWGLPVIHKDWLLECAKLGRRAPEKDFCVMDSSKLDRTKDSTVTFTNTIEYQGEADNASHTPIQTRKTVGDNCLQLTPVNKIMEEVRKSALLGTPTSPQTSKSSWLNINTPKTPLGAFIRSNPSPELRKEMQHFINQLPNFAAPTTKRMSTPLSEFKRRYYQKLFQSDSQNESNSSEMTASEPPDDVDAGPSQNAMIDNKLKQLENMLSSNNNSNRRISKHCYSEAPPQGSEPDTTKDSQPFTVGWDYMVHEPRIKIFLISGVDNDVRQKLTTKLENLGATVSDLANYDPNCTHLICPKPVRNEKTLSCMAAGKWILHISYVDECLKAGRFLDEEEFEFGNPKAIINVGVDNENRMQAIHWWRKTIGRRGYGAFNDMRAIVVAHNRESIVRVIEAGGGVVIDASPPFEGPINATHCLMEAKNITDPSEYIPLAKQGIYCLNTLYISEILYRAAKDVKNSVFPSFTKYYKH